MENQSANQDLAQILLEMKGKILEAGLLLDEEKSGFCGLWIDVFVGEYRICYYPRSAIKPWEVLLGDTSLSFETLDECISFIQDPQKTSLAKNPFVARALDPGCLR